MAVKAAMHKPQHARGIDENAGWKVGADSRVHGEVHSSVRSSVHTVLDESFGRYDTTRMQVPSGDGALEVSYGKGRPPCNAKGG